MIGQLWRALAARLAAVIVSAAVLWLAAHAGLEVSEDQRGQAVSFFTDALTGLGWVIGMSVYPIAHRLINRKIDPLDAAKEPVRDAAHVYIDPLRPRPEPPAGAVRKITIHDPRPGA